TCGNILDELTSYCPSCDNTGYSTPRASTPTQTIADTPEDIISLKKEKKKLCILCSKDIDQSDYENHISSCSADDYCRNDQDVPTRNTSTEKRNDEKIVPNKKQTKYCILCSKDIDQSEYEDHLVSCSTDEDRSDNQFLIDNHNKNSNENKSSSQIENYSLKEENILKKKRTKHCILCSKDIYQSDYEDHVAYCSNDNNRENFNHTSEYRRDPSTIYSTCSSSKHKPKKHCVFCSQSINQQEYEEHISICSNEQTNDNYINKQENKTNYCIICSKSIPEYEYAQHVASCSLSLSSSFSRKSSYENDHKTRLNSIKKDDKNELKSSSNINTKRKKDCIICFKSIDLSQYENHVLECVAQTDKQLSSSSNKKNLKCLTCNCSINKEDRLYREINCHDHHNHCLLCLQRSMEEFVRNSQTPVCHKTLCDYELSRYDISLMPLERRVSDRLLKLVKGQQRPFCSKCRFYIDLNQYEDFDEHIQSCEDLIPCEYCQLPYPFKQLEDHTRQCQHANTSHYEKLTHFVLTKTKYPFPKDQIRHFIEQQRKNGQENLDPWSIIDALAIFGSTFPYEMARRDCDVCMESCPYDDIYVFDCNDNHKICYSCYYQSCKSKMNNGEILTCALCTNPLKDGELNQLRIPDEELKIIRDYQMKKTFD
ncbi:unnamed protein product, partial [Rotaria sp. Silwood2]